MAATEPVFTTLKLARQHFVNNDGVRFHENICLCLLSERTQLLEHYAPICHLHHVSAILAIIR